MYVKPNCLTYVKQLCYGTPWRPSTNIKHKYIRLTLLSLCPFSHTCFPVNVIPLSLLPAPLRTVTLTYPYSTLTCYVLVGMRALLCRPTPRDLGGRGLGNCARLQGPNATRQSKKNLSARTDLPLVLSIFQSRFVTWELPQPIPTSKSDFVWVRSKVFH